MCLLFQTTTKKQTKFAIYKNTCIKSCESETIQLIHFISFYFIVALIKVNCLEIYAFFSIFYKKILNRPLQQTNTIAVHVAVVVVAQCQRFNYIPRVLVYEHRDVVRLYYQNLYRILNFHRHHRPMNITNNRMNHQFVVTTIPT